MRHRHGWSRAKPQLVLPFDPSSGVPENHRHMFWVVIWQIQHRWFANPILQGDSLGDIVNLCQNLRHSSLIRGNHASIADVCSKFRCTGESWTHIVMTVTTWLPIPFRNQHSRHDYWVPVSEYETWANLFVATLQLVQEYHSSSGTTQIGIPGHRRLRHGSGIHGEAAPFAARHVLAYDLANDWSSGTTEICNWVQNDVFGFQWGQLWQAATYCECLIPGQARLNSDNQPPKRMFPTS